MKIALQSFAVTDRCLLLLFLFLLWSTPSLASQNGTLINDFNEMDVSVSEPDMVKVEVIDSKLALSIDCSEKKLRSIHIPIHHDVVDKKVRLTFSKVENIPYMGKFETTSTGQVIPKTFEHNYLVYQKEPAIFSLSNKYYENLSLYFKCRVAEPQVTGTVFIDAIEIEPISFIEDRDFAYILAEILLLFFVLPGFLAYCLFFGAGKKTQLLALLTPMSLGAFLTLYLVLLANQQLVIAPNSAVLLGSYIVLNVILFLWLGVKNQLGTLTSNLRLIWVEMLAIIIVVLAVAAIITENLELPLFTFTYNHLRYLTYGAFGAHDPIFQYINGIAILHDEPFSKYYANRQLFYGVQDRGMLVGVIYAVVRGIAYPFHAGLASSNGFYTLFGSILNILVLLPVFALHRYFFARKNRPLLILFLLSANAFILTNYYITWYKLAGAGLVISGIVLLLQDKKSIRQWLLTGIIWGLATNFHPSLALTYPIATLWLLYRFSLERKRRIVSVVSAFLVLIVSFAVMNVPWTMVKATHFQDTNELFRQHFLALQPYDTEQGIVGSIKNFAGKYTLEEQLSTRLERLGQSFRIEEIQSMIEGISEVKAERLLRSWNRLEASYIMFVLAPLLILLGTSAILTRLLPATAWNPPLIVHTRDFYWLLITQVVTIFFIIFGSFGPYSPDITWHLPMSCMAIVIYLLVHANIALGKIGISLIVLYSLFAYYRLLMQFF